MEKVGRELRIVMTPGFTKAMEVFPLGWGTPLGLAQKMRRESYDWIAADPEVSRPHLEDQGSTLRMKSPFPFYAIEEDHRSDCGCGCGGSPFVTFMLKEEY